MSALGAVKWSQISLVEMHFYKMTNKHLSELVPWGSIVAVAKYQAGRVSDMCDRVEVLFMMEGREVASDCEVSCSFCFM
jgi:hypothetical protein